MFFGLNSYLSVKASYEPDFVSFEIYMDHGVHMVNEGQLFITMLVNTSATILHVANNIPTIGSFRIHAKESMKSHHVIICHSR